MDHRLKNCEYGGGRACSRQGGSGAKSHSGGYVHPQPSVREWGGQYEDGPVVKGSMEDTLHMAGLVDPISDDMAKSLLEVALPEVFDEKDFFNKAIREFDVETEEGVDSLLSLLPIMDPEILKDIMIEIWPGYTADESFEPRTARLEIKGYLLDYLDARG